MKLKDQRWVRVERGERIVWRVVVSGFSVGGREVIV
jgi:hypothetical protein